MPDIQHSIQIASPPETIYPLIATPQGLGKWWAADITQPDGAVELGFFGRTTVYRLRLKVDKPPFQAVWACETGTEWGGTEMRFVLEAHGSGSLLRFSHAGWQTATEYFLSCNTVWGELMFRLKAAAEGKPRGPLFQATDLVY